MSEIKKLSFLLIIVLFSTNLIANNSHLFQYNTNEVQKELGNINQLEQFVDQHPGITLENLKHSGNELAYHMNSDANLLWTGTRNDNPEFILGIVAGVGTCLLGVGLAGVLLALLLINIGAP